MLGLLLRVAVGVAVAAVAGAAAYTIYKKITKKTLVEEANKQLIENDIFQQALKAKIIEVERSSGTVTLDILDRFDEPVLEDIEVHGEEIDSSIKKGQKIKLDVA